MIRITNNMMVNDLRRNLNNNMLQLDKWNRQLSTTKKINKPSDNPGGLVKSLRLRTNITESEQYLDNIGEAINFMDTTDSAFDGIGNILHRARELAVKAANGSNDPGAHEAIASEMKQLNDQLKMIANTSYGSKYIFAGRNVTEAPCQDDKWLGNDFPLDMEIGHSNKMPINLEMKDFFIGTEPYKKDIKIKDSTVITNINAENLQSGKYGIKTSKLTGSTVGAEVKEIDQDLQGVASSIFGSGIMNNIPTGATNQNASIELTVTEVNSDTGMVSYAYTAHEYDSSSGAYTQKIGEFSLEYGGDSTQTIEIKSDEADPIKIEIKGLDSKTKTEVSELKVGDKGVLNLSAEQTGANYDKVEIYYDYSGNEGDPLTGEAASSFVFKEGVLDGKKADIKFFTVDDKGQSFDSTIGLDIGKITDADPAAAFNTKPGIFSLMDDLVKDVEKGDLEAISSKLGAIDDKTAELLSRRSTIGAKVNRLELQKKRMESTKINYTGLLSQNEDADMAEVIMNLKMQDYVYRSSLAAGARIIMPSLVDFLR